jgi:transposase
MKLYAATDLHSNNNVLVILDEQDRVVLRRRLPNQLAAVLAALEPYKGSIEAVAVESTYNWYWLVDGLEDAGYAVKLVNTSAVKIYDGLKHTDDEDDARHLAHLLRLNILPTGHICPKEERGVRDLLRKRSQLVRCRTVQVLSIQNLVSRNTGQGIKLQEIRALDDEAVGRLFGGDEDRVLALRSNLAVMRCLDEQVKELERVVLGRAQLKPAFEKLMTVVGIGKILGMTIMYETGTLERFRKVGQFASYARCVQSSRWTNGKKKAEGNRKNGNKYLDWAFVEAAHFAVRYSERARRFYERKKTKKNGAVATKAVAHKLARACYHVMRDQVPFEEERAFA